METLKFTFSPNEAISEGYESIDSPGLLSDVIFVFIFFYSTLGYHCLLVEIV